MIADQDFIAAVAESSSIRDLMKRLDYSASGQTSKMLQLRMKKLGLQFGKESIKSTKPIPLEEILVQNSTYTSRTLKNRLIKAGLLQETCYKCPVENIWQGKPLVLQLEHKNGIHNDNRIENLELLCPNCHTQTDTWGRKTRQAPLV